MPRHSSRTGSYDIETESRNGLSIALVLVALLLAGVGLMVAGLA